MSLEDYSKKRFLIVDELDSFRFSTKKMLLALGIKLIDTMKTGQQVISGFQNIDYDVILCNFDLGKGKNGQELLEELREKRLLKFTGLFFIVSAEVGKDKVMGTIENEPDGYIVKPITTANLKKRLLEKLSQKDATKSICLAIDANNYAKAIELCNEKILKKDRYSLWCMKTSAWLHSKQGDNQEALNIYEQAAKTPKQSWALLGTAKTKMDMGELDQAKHLLAELLTQPPEHIEAYDLLAEIHLEQDNITEAQKLIEKAISSSPNSVLRQQALANIYLKNNQIEKAVSTFRKVIKLGEKSVHNSPDNYLALANGLATASKGDISAKGKQQTKDAGDALQKANKVFYDTPELAEKSKLIEAKLHFGQNRIDSAEQIITEITSEATHKSSDLYLQLADTLYFMEKPEQAEIALTNISMAYENDKQTAQAIADLRESNTKQEIKIEAVKLNKKGIKYHSSGELDKAIKALQRACKLTPHHISANLNLLQLLLIKQKTAHSDTNILPQCVTCLRNIRHIKHKHTEYRRYKQIKKLVSENKPA